MEQLFPCHLVWLSPPRSPCASLVACRRHTHKRARHSKAIFWHLVLMTSVKRSKKPRLISLKPAVRYHKDGYSSSRFSLLKEIKYANKNKRHFLTIVFRNGSRGRGGEREGEGGDPDYKSWQAVEFYFLFKTLEPHPKRYRKHLGEIRPWKGPNHKDTNTALCSPSPWKPHAH